MLRIASAGTDGPGRVLRVEGRVVGPWVEELQRCCEAALAAGPTLTLDLAGVSFADRPGVALLRSLGDRGITLVNCSAFLTELLKE